MRRRRLRALLMASFLGWSGAASAMPVQLDQTAFDALTAGNPTTQIEDFSSFPLGLNSTPLVLGNGTVTFTASAPNIGTAFCASGRCLAGNQGTGTRVFDAFPGGTQIWGTDFSAFGTADTFDVTAVGASGTLVLSSVVPGTGNFFGFLDSAGLTSVTFVNTSTFASNYALDDVTTAVPEPSTVVLLGLGMVALAARRSPSSSIRRWGPGRGSLQTR